MNLVRLKEVQADMARQGDNRMKLLPLIFLLSGCVTHNYYPAGEEPEKTQEEINEEAQRKCNEPYGTTNLIFKSCRRLR